MMQTFTDEELVAYAVIFGLGLVVSVYGMLNGTVRPGRNLADIRPPLPAFNTPVVGAALTALGAVGYLVAKYSQVGTITTIVLALVAAAAGWFLMTMLMARWALRGPLHDPHEEMEELQGSVAMVVFPIQTDSLGEIEYTFRGEHTICKARSIDGTYVEAGTEVVIDTIENGVASVERWSAVEQRL